MSKSLRTGTEHWHSYAGSSGPCETNDHPWLGGMTCQNATVSCANTEDINVIVGYKTPATVLGTIVLLSGAGGTDANADGEVNFASSYFNNNYQVVEIEWNLEWEDATNGLHSLSTPPSNILVAACRPATILNWVYGHLFTSGGGMCAQGFSGGSAAVAYALAWYGAGNWLDKVQLLSGPVFSDIKSGCMVPNASQQQVCGGTPTPSFCQLGTGTYAQAPWTPPIVYSGGPLDGVRIATGDITCQGGSTTSQTSNNNWAAMSIMTGTGNPSFSYPNTAVTGFVCATTTGASMNNSSSEGWIFFDNPSGNPISAKNVALYAVTTCDDQEGVNGTDARVPAILVGTPPMPEDGYDAIVRDMSTSLTKTLVCTNYH
jgi:hypothetical protein